MPARYICSLPHIDILQKQPVSVSNSRTRRFTIPQSSELIQFAARLDMGNEEPRVMKLQVAATLCVVLLVASAVAAAGCDIFQLVPSKQCCAKVAKMGKGAVGAKCSCSLLSNSLPKPQGVVPRVALRIPLKCSIAVPKSFVCQGIRVPGS